MLAIEIFDALAPLRRGLFNEFFVRKVLVVSALVLTLAGCSGSSVGIGGATGFPGVGLGAGFSIPIGTDRDVANSAWVSKVKGLVESKIPDLKAHYGKICTVRVTADKDGLLMDVKRMDGDNELCDAVMNGFYTLNKLPEPPVSMAEHVKQGMIIDITPN